jgi:hypothetical protein
MPPWKQPSRTSRVKSSTTLSRRWKWQPRLPKGDRLPPSLPYPTPFGKPFSSLSRPVASLNKSHPRRPSRRHATPPIPWVPCPWTYHQTFPLQDGLPLLLPLFRRRGMPLKHLSSCPLTLKSRKFSLPRSTRRHAPQARLPHPFLLVPCQVSARPITSLPPPFPSEMMLSTHWRSARTPPCRRFTPPKHRMSQIWAPHVGGGR